MALKIIKHCEEESDDGVELVQGVLLGLVVDKKLEITNCFPIPRASNSSDEDTDNCENGVRSRLIVLDWLNL